jgi:hypothetical protein
VPRDHETAYEIYLKCSTSKANNRLGVMHYYHSPVIEHSIEKAIGFFKLALEGILVFVFVLCAFTSLL